MGAGWIFTPATGAMVDVPDSDYLHYGFWLEKTTDEDGIVTYNEVETFAGSSAPASGTVADVEGSATYEGGAVGVYVRDTYTEGGGVRNGASSGHFSADAVLTAHFGGDDVAPNLEDTITGTIDNFALSGGEVNDWSVNLARSAESDTGTHSGVAEGGGAPGSYNATFHGDTEDADGGDTVQPSSVVGEFNANFSNGAVAGAFGARRQ